MERRAGEAIGRRFSIGTGGRARKPPQPAAASRTCDGHVEPIQCTMSGSIAHGPSRSLYKSPPSSPRQRRAPPAGGRPDVALPHAVVLAAVVVEKAVGHPRPRRRRAHRWRRTTLRAPARFRPSTGPRRGLRPGTRRAPRRPAGAEARGAASPPSASEAVAEPRDFSSRSPCSSAAPRRARPASPRAAQAPPSAASSSRRAARASPRQRRDLLQPADLLAQPLHLGRRPAGRPNSWLSRPRGPAPPHDVVDLGDEVLVPRLALALEPFEGVRPRRTSASTRLSAPLPLRS